MTYEVVRSRACDRDLELIFDHLFETYQSLGDTAAEALERAAARVRGIEDDLEDLGRRPHMGALCPEVMPDLRRATRQRAVFYFQVHEPSGQVRMLAVFFGGQDHQRHMLRRLGTGS